jgi:hypothetical protein
LRRLNFIEHVNAIYRISGVTNFMRKPRWRSTLKEHSGELIPGNRSRSSGGDAHVWKLNLNLKTLTVGPYGPKRVLSPDFIVKTLILLSMPREHRKRGKKHRKPREDEAHFQDDLIPTGYLEPEKEPSWIHPALETSPETSIEAPFGYVDADVKAYFRTVDDQIRDWQEAGSSAALTEEMGDPNEGTLC